MNWAEFHPETFIFAVIISFIASGGFWNYLLNRKKKPDAATKLLMGLAHLKIAEIGIIHIDIGSISEEAYNDLVHYLYDPYIELGGNGSGERVMKLVKQLPITPTRAY